MRRPGLVTHWLPHLRFTFSVSMGTQARRSPLKVASTVFLSAAKTCVTLALLRRVMSCTSGTIVDSLSYSPLPTASTTTMRQNTIICNAMKNILRYHQNERG